MIFRPLTEIHRECSPIFLSLCKNLDSFILQRFFQKRRDFSSRPEAARELGSLSFGAKVAVPDTCMFYGR